MTRPDQGEGADPSRDTPETEAVPISVSSDAEFQRLVAEADVMVVVDFHARWCGPCKWLEPTLDEVARDAAGRALVLKVDVDDAPEAARRFGVASVPTVILLEEGQETARSIGVEPERVKGFVGLSSVPSVSPSERDPSEGGIA